MITGSLIGTLGDPRGNVITAGFLMGLFGHTGVTRWNWRSFAVAVAGAVVLLLILGLIRGRGRLRGR